jgi:hypothetical protein
LHRDLQLNTILFFDAGEGLVWGSAYDGVSGIYSPLERMLEAPLAPGDVSGAKDRVDEIAAEHARAVAALQDELDA